MRDAPKLADNPTEEDVNTYVKQVMEFVKELPNKKINKNLHGYLRVQVADMVMARILELHVLAEQTIFDLGILESCQTQTD